MAITSVKIHPAIGIARVGNSPSDFFVGPEIPGDHTPPSGGYKDAQCRVKRQAARFRVFAYDENGVLVQELTAADAEISWTVHLVNKKGATGRNGSVPAGDVTIDPGARTITGPSQQALFDNGTFTVPSASAVTVPLGEIRTDVNGRLLVLGGFGRAETPTGEIITDFLDNDNWFDDISDGPVTASVTLNGGGGTFNATGAWVVTTPPKYAPGLDSVVTLYDTLYQWAVDQGWLSVPASPVSYVQHVYPILQRATDVQWVRSTASGHHGFVHPVTDPVVRQVIFDKLKGNGGNMPQINPGPDSAGDLTPTQYAILTEWNNGNFTDDWPPPPPSAQVTPDGLDRAALEACVGAAFYPGIEGGGYPQSQAPFRDPTNYSEPFRLDHTLVSAGDVTSRMALPWQADFNACATNWWPVPRPNNVIPQGGSGSYEDWDRGIGSPEDMASFWHTLGFVVPQGPSYVEVDRCDAPSITLVTPALDYGDVPLKPLNQPNTLALAVVFEVQSTSGVSTLQFTGPPTNTNFSNLTLPQAVGPTVGGDVVTVRLWVKYTTTNVGDPPATGTVTVEHAESGQTWTVPLTAQTVARVTAAVALVLDRSGSMTEDRGDGTSKIQSLREACTIFVELMQEGDGVSLVRYNENAQELRPVTLLGAPGDPFDTARADILGVIAGSDLDPQGATSIGDGIHVGRVALDSASGYVNKSLVVLTDGKENSPQFIADVASEINSLTFSVGLGTAANTSAAALQTISGNNGGYLLVTGPITTDNRFLLSKYFLQILAGISNAEVVLDPAGVLVPGAPQIIPVRVTEQDSVIEVILLTPNPKYVTFLLRSPMGKLIYPSSPSTHPQVQYVEGRGVSFYRVALPVELEPLRPDQEGTWQVILALGRKGSTGRIEGRALAQTHATSPGRGHGLPYSVIVHAYSNISLQAQVAQASLEPGAEVLLSASLTETGIPVERNARVWAEVQSPGGVPFVVNLQLDTAGRYHGAFRAVQSGTYRIRVRATGASSRGHGFQRERTLTASVWVGGGQPGLGTSPSNDPARRLCALLRCLLGRGVITPQLEKLLAERGLDLRALRECIAHLCAGPPLPEVERTPAQTTIATGVVSLDQELRQAVALLQRYLDSR